MCTHTHSVTHKHTRTHTRTGRLSTRSRKDVPIAIARTKPYKRDSTLRAFKHSCCCCYVFVLGPCVWEGKGGGFSFCVHNIHIYIRPTQSVMYVPLQVKRFADSVLLIVQYRCLKSCSGDFYSPESDPPHKIMRYWLYYSIWLGF